MLILPQSETEALLEARLNALGVQIDRGVALVSFEDHEDHIEAKIVNGEGKEVNLEAQFLVGADGANSLVRKRWAYRLKGLVTSGTPFWVTL